MFHSRCCKDQNLTIIEIFDGMGTIARFVPERGGILAELFLSGSQIFYLDRETLHNKSKNIRGGNPVLFPICGPLDEGKYEIDGRTFEMRQHGFARNFPWEVTDVCCEELLAQITMTFVSNDETKAVYPFDFKLEFTYEIHPDRIIIRQRYLNNSQMAMPFYAGFHPYFLANGLNIKNLFLPSAGYFNIKTSAEQSIDCLPDFRTLPETNLVFTGLSDSKTSFERDDGCRIIIEFDENFPYLVLWALAGKDFFCLEPWMGNNYDLNRGKARSINPMGKLEAVVSYVYNN